MASSSTNMSSWSGSVCTQTCGIYLQFFANMLHLTLMTPVILYFNKYFPKVTIASLVFLILGGMSVTFVLVYQLSIDACIFFDNNYYIWLLHRPWFRWPSYFVGVILATQIFKYHFLDIKIYITRVKRVLMYSVAFAISIICIIILLPNMHC